MNIDKLKAFCIFLESGACYETTAKILNKSASGIYKSIKALEANIGHKLVESSDHQILITDQGHVFYKYARQILDLAARAVSSLDEDFYALTGTIRILTTQAIAALWITDDLAEFVKTYPDIQVTIVGSDTTTDIHGNFDVSIKPKLDDPLSALDQKLLTTQEMGLYASEEYVSKFGNPASADDLSFHRLLGYGEGVDYPYEEINWHLYLAGPKLKPSFNINTGLGILRGVENSIGIGPISNIGASISRVPLVRILPQIKGPVIKWYFITDKITAESKKISALYNYLHKRFDSNVNYAKIDT